MVLKLLTKRDRRYGQGAGELKAIVILPKPDRQAVRRRLDEKHCLVDTEGVSTVVQPARLVDSSRGTRLEPVEKLQPISKIIARCAGETG